VSFSDVLPTGLVVQPGSMSGPTGWTFTVTPTGLEGITTVPLPPGESVSVTFGAVVGELPRSSIGIPVPNLTNDVCVDSTQPDMNPDDNCTLDVVPTRSIALSGSAVCRNDTPLVSYSIIPNNILSSPPPVVAVIWWSAEGYANRDPDIDASDEAALLADGALVVNYPTLPADWTSGTPITGEVLWPGAAVDSEGNPTDWPGWSQDENGEWFLDPTDPFYAVRTNSIVEFRINPTVAFAVSYPPATINCLAAPPGTPTTTGTTPGDPTLLAMTGTALTIAGPTGAMMLAVGAVLVRRRRRRRAA